MHLRFLPVNNAWAFLFGDNIETATIQDMGNYGRFFASRNEARSAAYACGLEVLSSGKVILFA